MRISIRLVTTLNKKGLQVPEELYNGKSLASVNFWEEVPTYSINLSHNQLQKLPDQLSSLADLKVLDVSHNKLNELSSLSFPALLSLDVGSNALKGLPQISPSFPSLQKLSCSKNALRQINLGCLTYLLELQSAKCQLEAAPLGLNTCTKLTRLILASNKIQSFPKLQALSSLADLDLSHNLLQGPVPDQIGQVSALRCLNLSQNSLDILPEAISGLKCLTELRISFNKLKEIPGQIYELTALQTLDFRDNKIASIPASTSRLSLTCLDARNNSIQALTPWLGSLTSLKFLGVLGNPIKGIRPTLLNASTNELLAYLRSRLQEDTDSSKVDRVSEPCCSVSNGLLSLAGCRLSTVPEEVWSLGDQVQSLDLSQCNLQQIEGTRLVFLPKLSGLNLAKNCLEEWPLSCGKGELPLRALDVSNNPLGDIPVTALSVCFSTLTSLKLSGIKAVERSGYCFLSNGLLLQELNLSHSNLTLISEAILQLRRLEKLDLSSNSIAQVPEQVTALASLSELDIRNNAITKLPPQMGLMSPTLKLLLVDGNPLRTVRHAILQKGTPSILQYLRDRLPAT